jgi:hypothetical protein
MNDVTNIYLKSVVDSLKAEMKELEDAIISGLTAEAYMMAYNKHAAFRRCAEICEEVQRKFTQ